ncbi:MAG: hypothetical protein ACP5SP_04380 [Caldisericum sp.]|uniref:hypothetical protein n=1 Tax=Caldisericum sp. TaxID=2499687 RepID=UPI003D0A054A
MMFKKGILNDIFRDYIIFRELNPVKKSLPNFETLKDKLELQALPRKKDKEYALVISEILKSAMDFSNIVYLGDTFLSDLTVIKNLEELGFDIFGVITDEEKTNFESPYPYVVFNNSWAKIKDFVSDKISDKTIVIIDIDKTAIGAHGRNHLPIDKARTDAIVSIAEAIFQKKFDSLEKGNFLKLYKSIHTKDLLNFTQDNQDIVSITTLIIYSNAISLDEFLKLAKTTSFEEFIEDIRVSGQLQDLVYEVKENIKAKSPTLFPTFRKVELEKTLARMNFLPDDTPLETLLSEEILITGEVFDIGKYALSKGAIVFGVSDKPEVASFSEDKSIFTKLIKIYP